MRPSGLYHARSTPPRGVSMVVVAQLVRAPRCGRGGRGFESRRSPFSPPEFPLGWDEWNRDATLLDPFTGL